MKVTTTEAVSSFTLLVLLVVVAIIAILAGLLLPSLASAKQKARKLKCSSNLKQIGIAFAFYSGAYNALYPVRENDAYYTYYCWGGKQGNGVPSPVTSNQVRLLNPYIGKSGTVSRNEGGSVLVFLCPSDDGANTFFPFKAMKPSAFDASGNSYSYNCTSRNPGFDDSLFGKKTTEIKNPAKVVLANDLAFDLYSSMRSPVPVYWHEKKLPGAGNVLFADGHVGYFRAKMDGSDIQRGNGWTFIYDDR